MEKIIGGVFVLAGVVILLWIVFLVLKNLFSFSSIPKKIQEHAKQSNLSYRSIVEYNYRMNDKKEALVILDLDHAEIKKYRFVRQSMLEEESRDGFDMNSSIESLAFGLINSRYRNYEKEDTLWTRYGNAELYEVCVPFNFAEYSLVFSSIIEMDKDALAIHLALEKQVKAIVTYKQYLLKEDVVLKAGSKDVVTNFIEFDVSCKFEFESDSKYSHACIGSWVTVVAIDNVPVEV